MLHLPVRWLLTPDGPWQETVAEIEAAAARRGGGPAGGVMVSVWDGSAGPEVAPLPHEGPLLLLGGGPFARFARPAAAHLFSPTAPELWAAILALAQGFSLLAPERNTSIISTAETRRNDPLPRQVTVREQQVLECIARGLPNKAIAVELEIGLGTVKFHLSHLMEKFAVQNRAELVMAAAREGYLTV